MLYERILNQRTLLRQQITELQAKLRKYPAGKIVCCHHGKKCKWYHSDGKNRVYIPKANRQLAEQLAVKKYLSCVLEELLQEAKALDSYLIHHSTSAPKSSNLLIEQPGYRDLLSPYFKPHSEELSEWEKASYERNDQHPEHLIHKTTSGHLVRSKSESIIAHFLHTNRIPFRYECALRLDPVTLYPDFTIRHPANGDIYYWEHFGLMDDISYCKNAASKIQLYSTHGIIPSIHLITTYETQNHPLSTETVQKVIENYFL